VLFEKLGFKKGKKTKTGYSTDEKVLNSLRDEHPIIENILDYRESYKLRSTYIEPLLKLASFDKNQRIYTSFLQTGTATGRLSSKNPNLQNIPVRTELGREIRKAFIAKEGYKLVSFDYSQIELRLLAHFSKDIVLVEAFKEDKDIHLETAMKIFGEENAKEKRAIAKSINFGLLYGMGSRKLADTLGITSKEAKGYIKSYFASFPTVKSYLESIVEFSKEKGFVETLLKRKRYFNYDLANSFLKASFEREAINTLFQGSAADIIKLSMNRLHKDLKQGQNKMLLQIHDELIFEVREEEIEEFCKATKEIMENIYKLEIPLKCSKSIGDNWGELK
jgi:DNA polymerase-1